MLVTYYQDATASPSAGFLDIYEIVNDVAVRTVHQAMNHPHAGVSGTMRIGAPGAQDVGDAWYAYAFAIGTTATTNAADARKYMRSVTGVV